MDECDYNELSQYSSESGGIGELIFMYRYVLAGLLLLGLVIFKVSGSSMGIWQDLMLGKKEQLTSTLWGYTRRIRSDEYGVNFPYLMSQYKNGFPYFNTDIRGTATDMFMVYGQPVWDIAVIFRPFHWGYLILGAERGLSFFWCGRLIALFLVSFEFGRLITEDKKRLAMVFALLVTGAPVVQWWFAINCLVEMLVFGMGAVLLLNTYMLNEAIKTRLLCAAGLVICAGGYCLSLYPAWMIPLGYIFAAFALWVIIKSRRARKWHISDAVIISLSVVFTGAMLARVMVKSWDAIQIVMNTVYPGDRKEFGGGAFSYYFRYAMALFLPFKEEGVPGNLCEAATVIDFFPLCYVLPLWLLIKDKKRDMLTAIMLIAAVFLNIWIIFKMPEWFGTVTALSSVQPNRCAQIIGFLNIALLFRAISLKDIQWKKSVCVALGAVLAAFCTGVAAVLFNDYLSTGNLIFVFVWIGYSMYLILRVDLVKNKEVADAVVMLAVVGLVGVIFVNPIERGIGAVTDEPMYEAIEKIEQEDSGLWLCERAPYPANNYPIMAGAATINSTATYPSLETWSMLDPKGEYEDIYNRYAHILVDFKQSGDTEFELKNTDIFKVTMSVDKLKLFNVKYVLSGGDLTEFDSDKISFEELYQRGSWKIFKVHYNN